MNDLLRFYWQPELQSPSLVIGWSVDAGKLGTRVTDYLNKKLGGQSFCEIEPVEFFPLGGVTIEDDLVQFPESKFYVCPNKDLIVLKSHPPGYEWYKFLNTVLDAAGHGCPVKELYAIGGMVSLGAHTAPRELLVTFNSLEMQKALSSYNLAGIEDYETPHGRRPTLNSFLLWTGKRRSIPGVTLWVPVPFYLVAVDDPRAQRKVLEFLNQRLDLGLDLSDLDEEIRQQNRLIAEVRNNFPHIDGAIKRLESNLMLSAEENQKLAKEIGELLREKRG